jgi:hypothetical protein
MNRKACRPFAHALARLQFPIVVTLGMLNIAAALARASAGGWFERRGDKRHTNADGMLEARGAGRAQFDENKNGPDKQKMRFANKL